jgi:hypothetical protein
VRRSTIAAKTFRGDELVGHELVEEVGHRADEDHPRPRHSERLLERSGQSFTFSPRRVAGVHGFSDRLKRSSIASA